MPFENLPAKPNINLALTPQRNEICNSSKLSSERLGSLMMMEQRQSDPKLFEKKLQEFYQTFPKGCISYDTNQNETLENGQYFRNIDGAITGTRVITVTFWTMEENIRPTQEVFFRTPELETFLKSIKK